MQFPASPLRQIRIFGFVLREIYECAGDQIAVNSRHEIFRAVSAVVFLTYGVFADLILFGIFGLVRLVFCLPFGDRTIAICNNVKESSVKLLVRTASSLSRG